MGVLRKQSKNVQHVDLESRRKVLLDEINAEISKLFAQLPCACVWCWYILVYFLIKVPKYCIHMIITG